MKKVVDILGYDTSSAGLAGDLELAWELINSGTNGHYVACNNPHSLIVAESDQQFSRALSEADILLPDGIGVIIAAKILGLELNERVAGSEFFSGLSNKANQSQGIRYFFIGSSDEVLGKIADRLSHDYPNIILCGTYSPPFKYEFSEDDNQKMVAEINAAKPDVVWVGMTAPKQEKWIHEHKDQIDAPLLGAIGAVFDFYAGTKKRAPDWVCKMGLEWLPRLLREPKRLFRRNFISTPLFLLRVFQRRLTM